MEEEDGDISLSMLLPLRMLVRPGHRGGASASSGNSPLAVVAPSAAAAATTTTTTTAPITAPCFQLPRDWQVEKVLRSDASKIDTYYYEPATGQKFRSLKAVDRYLRGMEYTSSRKSLKLSDHVKSSHRRKMIVSGGMLLRLDKEESDRCQSEVVAPSISTTTPPFNLPDGWIVEEVPRSCNGQTDRYYYEPGTGRQFRSLSSVQKHLAETGEDVPLSQMFKLGSRVKNSGSRHKISREEAKTSTSESPKPPVKINWVLADPGGFAWNPFMGESMVPEPVKLQWANKFMQSMSDKFC